MEDVLELVRYSDEGCRCGSSKGADERTVSTVRVSEGAQLNCADVEGMEIVVGMR